MARQIAWRAILASYSRIPFDFCAFSFCFDLLIKFSLSLLQ